MAHAIGCLGSSVQTYRTERKLAAKRAAKVARKLRNQDRRPALVLVSHDEGRTFQAVKCRQGHLHHVQKAYLFADTVCYPSKLAQA